MRNETVLVFALWLYCASAAAYTDSERGQQVIAETDRALLEPAESTPVKLAVNADPEISNAVAGLNQSLTDSYKHAVNVRAEPAEVSDERSQTDARTNRSLSTTESDASAAEQKGPLKGTWRAGAIVGIYEAFDRDESFVWGGASIEHFLTHDISLNIELIGYAVDQHQAEDTDGAGLNVLARWHPLKSDDGRLSMFLEAGGGLAEFSGRTPGPKGTDFNFTLHAGIGGRGQLSERISLIFTPRYLHISNARIQGIARNPGIDAIGASIGFGVKF